LEVRDEVRQLAAPLAEEAGYELVDIEFAVNGRDRVIRVLLDKPGGITVGDCGQFSRRLADCLEMNQTLPGSYRLEVSSPGMERPLRSIDAVARFAGRRAAVATHEAHDGRRNFEGTLLAPDAGRVGVRLEAGEERWFEWAEIKSARLVVVDPWADLRHPRPLGAAGGRRPEEKSR
jgi:ribosome maturation factor RimP